MKSVLLLACAVLGAACAVLGAACASTSTAPIPRVSPGHCAPVELDLDGGIVKVFCLTADQAEKVLTP